MTPSPEAIAQATALKNDPMYGGWAAGVLARVVVECHHETIPTHPDH